jgi:hypothetical protein
MDRTNSSENENENPPMECDRMTGGFERGRVAPAPRIGGNRLSVPDERGKCENRCENCLAPCQKSGVRRIEIQSPCP